MKSIGKSIVFRSKSIDEMRDSILLVGRNSVVGYNSWVGYIGYVFNHFSWGLELELLQGFAVWGTWFPGVDDFKRLTTK